VFANQMRRVSATILTLIGPWPYVAFLVISSVLAGAAVYVFVERPMTRTLRRLLERQETAGSTLRTPLEEVRRMVRVRLYRGIAPGAISGDRCVPLRSASTAAQ
jgi:peptidoglycan/LPS O-acetylase OafA/YrhL